MTSSTLAEVHSLISEKRIEEAKRLIDKDHSLMEKKDESGRAVMHYAAVSGLLPLVELAITGAKQDIDLEDDLGWTPLMIAASSGREDICRYLLSHPTCNVSHANKNGQQPLHYAASKGHAQIVILLIENGADINGRDRFGATPLHRAASQGRDDIVKILTSSAGIRIDATDGEGKTPLFLAVEENRLDCITTLVLRGADASIQNKDGVAPYDVVPSEVAGKALLDARKRYNENK